MELSAYLSAFTLSALVAAAPGPKALPPLKYTVDVDRVILRTRPVNLKAPPDETYAGTLPQRKEFFVNCATHDQNPDVGTWLHFDGWDTIWVSNNVVRNIDPSGRPEPPPCPRPSKEKDKESSDSWFGNWFG